MANGSKWNKKYSADFFIPVSSTGISRQMEQDGRSNLIAI